MQAVGNVSGVQDFLDPELPFGPEPFPLFGAPLKDRLDLAALASPITHVSCSAPPFLHVHGRGDLDVPVSQARRMHAALQRVGAESELVELNGDHYINDTHQGEMEQYLLTFFRRTLTHP